MLARTFKTHKQLGITKKEYDALINVMNMLERGEVKKITNPDLFAVTAIDDEAADKEAPVIDPKGFNMGFAASKLSDDKDNKGCGTVACIGGWAAYFMGAKTHGQMQDYVWDNIRLEPLFFPGSTLSDISPQQAAQAIGNFLTTGAPNWEDIRGSK